MKGKEEKEKEKTNKIRERGQGRNLSAAIVKTVPIVTFAFNKRKKKGGGGVKNGKEGWGGKERETRQKSLQKTHDIFLGHCKIDPCTSKLNNPFLKKV